MKFDLKFVILVPLLFAPFALSGRNQICVRRSSLRRLKSPCKEHPNKKIVLLELPEGFIGIQPTAIKVKRCSGDLCTNDRRCSPVREHIRKKSLKVLLTNNDGSTICKNLEVEEHLACECSCIKSANQCKENEVFDEGKCECVCPRGLASSCQYGYQWSHSHCKCVCVSCKRQYPFLAYEGFPDNALRGFDDQFYG